MIWAKSCEQHVFSCIFFFHFFFSIDILFFFYRVYLSGVHPEHNMHKLNKGNKLFSRILLHVFVLF